MLTLDSCSPTYTNVLPKTYLLLLHIESVLDLIFKSTLNPVPAGGWIVQDLASHTAEDAKVTVRNLSEAELPPSISYSALPSEAICSSIADPLSPIRVLILLSLTSVSIPISFSSDVPSTASVALPAACGLQNPLLGYVSVLLLTYHLGPNVSSQVVLLVLKYLLLIYPNHFIYKSLFSKFPFIALNALSA